MAAQTAPPEAARREDDPEDAGDVRPDGQPEAERPEADADPDAGDRPPVEPKRLAKLTLLFEQALKTAAAWRWLGAMSAKRSEVDAVRSLVPDAYRGAFVEGARLRRAIAAGLPSKWRRDVRRALDALRDPPPGRRGGGDCGADPLEGVEVLELVRLTHGSGRGATFDLRLSTPTGELRLEWLTAAQLDSFPHVRLRGIEEGIALSRPLKRTPCEWSEMIGAALLDPDIARVKEPAPGEDIVEAVAGALREALRQVPDADEPGAVAAGSGFGTPLPDGRVFATGDELWREATRRPADSPPIS